MIQVEIECAINTRSPHYARSKGEQIALNVDGAYGSSADSFYSRYGMCVNECMYLLN
jgi:DNA-directed RNA polymerase-3 subunit RPC5